MSTVRYLGNAAGDDRHVMGHLAAEDGQHLLSLAPHLQRLYVMCNALLVDLLREAVIAFVAGHEGRQLAALR